jgi:hypothetical protein
MKRTQITTQFRLLAALATLLATSCSFLPFQQQSASPLFGTWATADHNKVTFRADAVVVAPDKGQVTTLGPGDCNGVYKLLYGRMDTAALRRSFSAQADLQAKLKQLLTKPEYLVADVTCDQGGTTYLMLDDRQMLAVYRDAGVGGVEALSRL